MQRPVVVVTARVHPGETPGSFAVQGLLAWLLSTNIQAVELRQAATVVVVPMLNPDGVALGKYRSAVQSADVLPMLNRNGFAPRKSRSAEQTTAALLPFMYKANNNNNQSLRLQIERVSSSCAQPW